MKTIEELTAELEEQRKQNEAMNAKNRELLDEMKAVKRKNSEIDIDAYHKTLDKVDALEAENAKLQNDVKLKTKDFEKLTASLNEKDSTIHKLLVSDGITKELAALKIDDFETFLPLFERNATVENGIALVNGKPVKESIEEWANGAGKRYIPAEVNTGGGSQGGSQGGGDQTPKTFKEKQEALFKKQ